MGYIDFAIRRVDRWRRIGELKRVDDPQLGPGGPVILFNLTASTRRHDSQVASVNVEGRIAEGSVRHSCPFPRLLQAHAARVRIGSRLANPRVRKDPSVRGHYW